MTDKWCPLRDRPFRTILIILTLAATVTCALTGTTPLMWSILRVLVSSVALGVVVTYTPISISALFQKERLTPGQGLAIGLWLSAAGVSVRLGLFSYFPPEHHLPNGTIHVAAAGLWMLAIGGILILGASNGIEKSVPPRAMVVLGFVTATTAAIVALLTTVGIGVNL